MSGIGVNPVEGRWDAAVWDGDPSAATPGVWDGSPLFGNVNIMAQVAKRQLQSALVRGTTGQVAVRQAPANFVRKP